MIVVDASALVAIAEEEPDRELYLDVLMRIGEARITPMNAAEAGLVLIGRDRVRDIAELNLWLADLGVEVDRGGATHEGVLDAYLRFGKGRHPARLNIGDCFAYALAKQLDAPLLYKGNDFAQTDIRSALQPT